VARRNAKRESALNEVLRKQRNADKKVSRLERQKGIRIRNTDENPHMSPAELRGMTTNELRAHERRLDRFTDRSNQYLPGANNTPLRRSEWEKYKALEQKNNTRARSIEQALGDVKLPGSDTTVNPAVCEPSRSALSRD
jgi:hypothetical protein